MHMIGRFGSSGPLLVQFSRRSRRGMDGDLLRPMREREQASAVPALASAVTACLLADEEYCSLCVRCAVKSDRVSLVFTPILITDRLHIQIRHGEFWYTAGVFEALALACEMYVAGQGRRAADSLVLVPFCQFLGPCAYRWPCAICAGFRPVDAHECRIWANQRWI